MAGFLRKLVSLSIGTLCSQSWALSIVVLGWTYRLMRLSALRYLWRRSGDNDSAEGFSQFVASTHKLALPVVAPNWFRSELRCLDSTRNSLLRTWFGAFGTNLRIGIQAMLTTWSLTLPAGVLWWYGWWSGWNNSFYKGYELAELGPVTSLSGVALFVVAMLYVPLAQARQAVTGEWRAFYQVGLIARMVACCAFRCLLLALIYSALWSILTIFIIAPAFFPQISPIFEGLSVEEARGVLRYYFLGLGAGGFISLLIVRLLAARVYAAALIKLNGRGRLADGDLFDEERHTLRALGFLQASEPSPAVWFPFRAFARLGTLLFVALSVFVWLGVSFEIHVGEFFNYHPFRGFINQPLVQLPCFSYLP